MAAEIVVMIGIDGLIQKANSLANQEFNNLGLGDHLEEHLRKMAGNLERLQAFLPDAESKAESSSPVNFWLRNVVKMAFKADDLLGLCAYDVGQLKVEFRDKKRNKVRKFFFSMNQFLPRSKIIRRIAAINARIQTIYHESNVLGLQSATSKDMSAVPEETKEIDSSANESQFLFHSRELDRIKELLFSTENEEDLFVTSIVGLGGSGKTIIAHQVYRDFDVMNRFDERIWISVSNDLDINKILKAMLQSVSRSTASGLFRRDAIVYKLVERLKGKRYLLILDDVWDDDSSNWSSLKDCLLKLASSRGSKILVTTHSSGVAMVMNSGGKYNPFYLGYLEEVNTDGIQAGPVQGCCQLPVEVYGSNSANGSSSSADKVL